MRAKGIPGRFSKHRQIYEGKGIPGACIISRDSSLRKLMRAARRGLVPNERIGVIVRAMESAAARPKAWRHASGDLYRSVARAIVESPVNRHAVDRHAVDREIAWSMPLASGYGAPTGAT